MKDTQAIGALIVLCVAFLFADRIVRIEPFLDSVGLGTGLLEWLGLKETIQRCGVDLAPCPHPLRCINGFCRSERVPVVRERNPLPVLP